MHPVLRRARLINDGSGHLQRIKAAGHYIAVRLDGTRAGREDQLQIAFGANQLPFTKAIQDNLSERLWYPIHRRGCRFFTLIQYFDRPV